MSDTTSDSDPLGPLAESFLDRLRRGEHPALSEFTDRHPELAERIRDLFPALAALEQVGPVAADATGAYVRPAGPAASPERLGDSPSSARWAAAAWASSTRPSRNRSAAAWR